MRIAFLLSLLLHVALMFGEWRGGRGQPPGTKLTNLLATLREPGTSPVSPDFPKGDATSAAEKVQSLSPSPKVKENRQQLPRQAVSASPTRDAQEVPFSKPDGKEKAIPIPDDKASSASGVLQVFEQGPPSLVELDLDILSGSDSRLVGRARSVYAASAGRYSVQLEGEPMTEQAVPVGAAQWRIRVLGSVRQMGLYPEAYYGEGELAKQLLGRGMDSRRDLFSGRTQDGLFDNQSLFYQFLHLPITELNSVHISTADGSYQIFQSMRLEDEVVEVPGLGTLKTNKYLFSTTGSTETFEIWILPQQRIMPFRVRHTSRDGKVTEQRVRAIRVVQ